MKTKKISVSQAFEKSLIHLEAICKHLSDLDWSDSAFYRQFATDEQLLFIQMRNYRKAIKNEIEKLLDIYDKLGEETNLEKLTFHFKDGKYS
jgi:hypothetical protein